MQTPKQAQAKLKFPPVWQEKDFYSKYLITGDR